MMINARALLKVARWLSPGLLALGLWAVTASAAAPGTPEAWVDRDRFPEAYSILTSERIMFPDNLGDLAIKIDSKRQLFVDAYLISSIDNLTREFHQPAKYAENPLMSGAPVAVLHDGEGGKFRMWSNTTHLESDDGLHWTEADPGPEGARLSDSRGQLRGLIYNPDTPKSSNPYKAIIERRVDEETGEAGGFYLYDSADGFHWQQARTRPVLQRTTNPMNPGPFWAKGTGDTSTFRYDEGLGHYIWDAKFNLYLPKEKIEELGIVRDHKPRLRLRTFSESDDLIHWSPPRFLLFPDRHDQPDCQLYGHVGFVYESMWIGVLRVMHLIPTGWKQVDLQLSYSRDGRHWSRPGRRQPFIPLGGADNWDSDYCGGAFTAPVLVRDELWFYYFGSRNPERDKDPQGHWPFCIGMARLRRDGFASLNAGQTPGRVITRPLTYEGRTLFVNAEVGDNGWVKAGVLSWDEQPVEGYALGDSVSVTKGTTRARMTWRSQDEMVDPGDDHVRLAFEVKNAKLYSFWIE